MIWQEGKKICRQTMFWIVVLFLLGGNLFFLYLSQKSTVEYQNIYEQKENYERYLAGDATADVNGVYQMEREKQEKYRDEYPFFLEQMQKRSENMKAVSIFSGKDSFSYRNIEKTCKDFQHLSGTTVQVEKPGKLYEKYWVDERAYRAIWEDTTKEIATTALGCLALIFAVSGIYPFDEKKKSYRFCMRQKEGNADRTE